MRPVYYRLEGHEAVPTDPLQWQIHFREEDRQVALSEKDGVTVSTVFLGMDHNHSNSGAPLLFETMVFGLGGEWEYWNARYSTWDEAIAGHAVACNRVLGNGITVKRVIPVKELTDGN